LRKFLLFLICFSIIVCSSFTAAFGLPAKPEIKSYGFMTENGKVITTLGEETSVKAYVDIENNSYINDDNLGTLMACYYDNGILVTSETLQISIDSNTNFKRMSTNSINVPIGSENIVFKVFVMDGLQNIRPEVNMYKWGSNPNSAEDGMKYAEAIKTVTGLSIMNGYEDGSFHAEGDITRAEFAAAMIRLLNKEYLAQNAKGPTPFSDVSEFHWSSGYVNLVAPLDFMDGYADERFAPDNIVTLSQAVKGFVTMLGYAPSVGVLGYPLGYINIAAERGITKDISLNKEDIISRGVLAKLIENSLEIPLCENNIIQDGMGTDKPYKTILTEYRNTVKLLVKVEDITNVEGQIKITPLNATQVNKISLKSKFDSFFIYNVTKTVKLGTSGIENFIGQRGTVYLYCNSAGKAEDSVVISFIKDSSVPELTVSAFDVDGVEAGMGARPYSVDFYYWANPTDMQAEAIEIVGAWGTVGTLPTVYWNGERKTFSSASAIAVSLYDYYSEGAKFYGTVTFAKMDDLSMGDYDTIFVSDYKNVVVDTVNTVTGRVTTKNNNSSIVFDPTNTQYKSTLYDSNGNLLNWADLKEWDVVSCKSSTQSTTGKIITVGTLVNNTVTGKVEGTQDQFTNRVRFTISGKEYKIDYIGIDSSEIALGDTGTFYLDILGRICWYRVSEPQITYGYIATAATSSDDTILFKMLEQGGIMQTLSGAKEVKVDNSSLMGQAVVDALKTSAQNLLINVDVNDKSSLAGSQLVKYTRNSEGKINSIDTVSTLGGDLTPFTLNSNAIMTYNSTDNAFSTTDGTKFRIDYNTKIFLVPTAPSTRTTYEEYSATRRISFFKSTSLYMVEAYDILETLQAKAIVVYPVDSDAIVNNDTPIFIIRKILLANNPEGVATQKVTGYYVGASQADTFTTDLYTESSGTLMEYDVGDVIRFGKTSAGYIKDGTVEPLLDVHAATMPAAQDKMSTAKNSDGNPIFRVTTGLLLFSEDNTTEQPFDIEVTNVVPGTSSTDRTGIAFVANNSTVFFTYDGSLNSDSKLSSNKITLEGLPAYNLTKETSNPSASELFVYSYNGIVKAVYYIARR